MFIRCFFVPPRCLDVNFFVLQKVTRRPCHGISWWNAKVWKQHLKISCVCDKREIPSIVYVKWGRNDFHSVILTLLSPYPVCTNQYISLIFLSTSWQINVIAVSQHCKKVHHCSTVPKGVSYWVHNVDVKILPLIVFCITWSYASLSSCLFLCVLSN